MASVYKMAGAGAVVKRVGEYVREIFGKDYRQPLGLEESRVTGTIRYHSHKKTHEWYYCVKGRGWFDMEEKDGTRSTMLMEPGSVLYVSPGIVHRLRTAEIAGDGEKLRFKILVISYPPLDQKDYHPRKDLDREEE